MRAVFRGAALTFALTFALLANTAFADGPTAPAEATGSPAGVEPTAEPRGELAASDRPEIRAELTPSGPVHVGDKVTLTLRMKAKAGDEITIPRDQNHAPFELLGARVLRSEETGSTLEQDLALDFIVFESGEVMLPALRVRVLTATGNLGFVSVPARNVRVTSAIGNEPNAAPKPPPEPVVVMEDDFTLLYLGGGLLAAVLIALAAWWLSLWWARRKLAALPPPPPKPPWDIANGKLAALSRSLPEAAAEARLPAWYDAVSDTVREYLGARYRFEGLESTTDEILAWAKKAGPRGLALGDLATLLGEADLAKFAKYAPTEADGHALLDKAARLVRDTTPVAAPAPAETTRPSTPRAA
jgi:hypothetical protein